MTHPTESPARTEVTPAPAASDEATVHAVGKLGEAFETIERARGHLYTFHQLTGTADFCLEEAIDLLREAGHGDLADRLARELLGRNVLPGRWTFQVVEDYDDTYYRTFQSFVNEAWQLTGGRRHAHEAQLKEQRRTPGLPGHEADPDEYARNHGFSSEREQFPGRTAAEAAVDGYAYGRPGTGSG